jgi:hypothetical protein
MRSRPFAWQARNLYESRVGRRGLDSRTAELLTELIVDSYNSAISGFPREQRPIFGAAFFTQEMSIAAHVGAFFSHGRNVFLLSDELAKLLCRTDLGDVRASDIRLPFQSFYLAFGQTFRESLPGPPNQVDGAYINQLHASALEIVVTSRRTDAEEDWLFARAPYFYAPLEPVNGDRTFQDLLEHAVRSGQIPTESQQVEPFDGVYKQFENETGISINDRRQQTVNEAVEYAKKGLPVFRAALALAINALCYLNTADDERDRIASYPEDSPLDLLELLQSGSVIKRKQAQARLSALGFWPVYILGSELKSEVSPGELTSREVSAHWRRGHWRRHAVGVGRAGRRLIWIHPTLVRADKGEPEDGHEYHVRAPKDPEEES